MIHKHLRTSALVVSPNCYLLRFIFLSAEILKIKIEPEWNEFLYLNNDIPTMFFPISSTKSQAKAGLFSYPLSRCILDFFNLPPKSWIFKKLPLSLTELILEVHPAPQNSFHHLCQEA